MKVQREVLVSMAILAVAAIAGAQTLEITNDADVAVTAAQTVNVGEHVRLRMRVTPPGTAMTNPQWIVSGSHLKSWITKDAQPVNMAVADYLAADIHFAWRDVTSVTSPNMVRASTLVNGSVLSATVSFNVVRGDKPEKFYSDDLLMENHNNWHSVYMFSRAETRRGDLFLAWHRSQLEYFNLWRAYYGYPPVANWDPATAWVTGTVPASKQHPSTSPAPKPSFAHRHDLTTLDLADQGLTTATEGEYDLVAQAQGRGRRPSFVSAGYILKTETVRALLGCTPPCTGLTRNGIATLPTWWKASPGANADPWYSAGCPNSYSSSTCTASSKKSLKDYTLRELGESIESGLYAPDFLVNYHALAHIAASDDMANPVTSMRDPIFWGWHTHLDSILSAWQAVQGVEATSPLSIYTAPTFNAGWSTVRVAFSGQVIASLVLPANVEVNGSRATAVTNVSTNSSQTYIFEFSGFAVPPSGPVEVVVRREVNNDIRTSISDPRPAPTLIVSTFGQILTPAVNRYSFTKP